jgi:serine/threonine-protein kinase
MSPEQMQSSKDADARSDIWALGVIIYELLTASSPFVADTMPELILKIMSATPPPLRNKRPDAPDGLQAAILKCLDKDRGKRFQTVGDLALALLPFGPKRSRASVERISGVMMAAGLAGSALALPPSSDGKEDVEARAETAAPWSRTAAPKTRGRVALFGVVGAAAIFGIAITVIRTHGKTTAPPVAITSSAAAGAPQSVRSQETRAAEEVPQKPPAQSSGSAEAASGSGAPSVSPNVPVDPPSVSESNRPASRTTKKAGSKVEPVAKGALPSGQSAPVAPLLAPTVAQPRPAQPAHPAQPIDEWGPGRH